MDNLYQEVYQYLIDNNIEEQEAIEVVNHLYEANIHEYGLLTENRGNAILNMLRTAGMMTGILESPAAQQTVKETTKKVLQGTPRQGSLFTKTGKPQNFTGGRTPFTGTNPVPAASSSLPKSPTKPVVPPGQMQIPGTSPRAQDLRNVTRNPNLGLPGNKQGFGATSPMPKPTPAGPPVKNTVSQSIRNLGKSSARPAASSAASKVGLFGRLKGALAPAGRFLSNPYVTAATIIGDDIMNRGFGDGTLKGKPVRPINRNPEARPEFATGDRKTEREIAAASQPKPEPTGERSAAANAEKQELAKAEAQRRREAAAPEPAPESAPIPILDYGVNIARSIAANKPIRIPQSKIPQSEIDKLVQGISNSPGTLYRIPINTKEEPYSDENIYELPNGEVRTHTAGTKARYGNNTMHVDLNDLGHFGRINPLAAAGQAQLQIVKPEDGEPYLVYTDHAYRNLTSTDPGEGSYNPLVGAADWVVHTVLGKNDPNKPNTGAMANYPPNIKGDVRKQIRVPYSQLTQMIKHHINFPGPKKRKKKEEEEVVESTWSKLKKHQKRG